MDLWSPGDHQWSHPSAPKRGSSWVVATNHGLLDIGARGPWARTRNGGFHLRFPRPTRRRTQNMPSKMLIDAAHPEETRVVAVKGNRVEEFDYESASKKQLRGNIYLAKVTRVEPSLQAAFVDYGGNRHGFLAFTEIHPDYYQIPVADRQALLEAEAEEESRASAAEAAEDDAAAGRRRRRGRRGRDRPDQQGHTGRKPSGRGTRSRSPASKSPTTRSTRRRAITRPSPWRRATSCARFPSRPSMARPMRAMCAGARACRRR